MKTIWNVLALSLILLPLTLASRAAERETQPIFSENFDRQIPGQDPQGWQITWKERKDALIAISNLDSTSGENSLLVNLRDGDEISSFAFARSLPPFKQENGEGMVFRFCVWIDGKATESEFSVALRAPSKEIHEAMIHFSLRHQGPTIFFYPSSPNRNWTENWNRKQSLGDWQPKRWYRFTVTLPPSGSKEAEASCQAEERTPNGWQKFGEPVTAPFLPFSQRNLYVQLVFSDRGSCFLFDDFSLEKTALPHP